ncbi:MAG TPA: hypothetical protein VJS88_08450, partial [Chthoniobacterales bacterium]|nr:hypothetical protein [Chthoniobacterales bacterium]
GDAEPEPRGDAIAGCERDADGVAEAVAASLLATPKPGEGGCEAKRASTSRRPQGDGYSAAV